MKNQVDFTLYTSIQEEFDKNKTLCNLFKILSVETWKRLEFTYIKPYIKLFETTVTQNIAFVVDSYKDKYGLPIEIYESVNEFANGNDLELILRFNRLGLIFYAPIQAKKIFRNEKYNNIKHGKQIESLLNYAKKRNGYPMYLFYNYLRNPPQNIGKNFELYGCTLLDANTIYNNLYKHVSTNGTIQLKWKFIPSFYNLEKLGAFPWHKLVCQSDITNLLKLVFPNEVARIEKTSELVLQDIFEIQPKLINDLPGILNEKSISFEGWTRSTDKILEREYYSLEDEKRKENNEDEKYNFIPQKRFIINL